jgi:hypothetical protein
VRTSGFRLYDDLVIVESIVGEQQLAEADDVALLPVMPPSAPCR